MTDVFISYSSIQRDVAHEYAEQLQQRGIEVWYDQVIVPGSDFATELDRRLREAKSVVLLWSHDASRSKWVQREALYAASNSKLIPVRLDDAELPTYLNHILFESAVNRTIADVVDAILPALPRPASHTTSLRSDATPRNRGFVFLSYCEEDYEFVEKLREFLTAEGFLFWEYNSGERDVEKLLYLELEAKINESVVVISVVSPDWKNSVWSAREYFYAKEIGRAVFLVEARHLEPTLAIAGEHRIRFWGERSALGFQLLSRELKRRGL